MPEKLKRNWVSGGQVSPEKLVEHFTISYYEAEDFRQNMRIYRNGAILLLEDPPEDLLFLLRGGEAAIFLADVPVQTLQAPAFLSKIPSSGDAAMLELRVTSEDALVYALDAQAFARTLSDRRWRELLLPVLMSDLKQTNGVQLNLVQPQQIAENPVKERDLLSQERDDFEEKILRVTKIFSTLLRVIEINKINLPPGSSAWASYNQLLEQITDLLETYAPFIATGLGDADPIMLSTCLKQGVLRGKLEGNRNTAALGRSDEI